MFQVWWDVHGFTCKSWYYYLPETLSFFNQESVGCDEQTEANHEDDEQQGADDLEQTLAENTFRKELASEWHFAYCSHEHSEGQ